MQRCLVEIARKRTLTKESSQRNRRYVSLIKFTRETCKFNLVTGLRLSPMTEGKPGGAAPLMGEHAFTCVHHYHIIIITRFGYRCIS